MPCEECDKLDSQDHDHCHACKALIKVGTELCWDCALEEDGDAVVTTRIPGARYDY